MNVINSDPEILGGTPVFNGTRVPLKNLFDYLETGETIAVFLDDFPSVSREQVRSVLAFAQQILNASTQLLLDECVTRKLKSRLPEHDVFTVPEMQWSGLKNGTLMWVTIEQGFDMLLTIDKNLVFQQNLNRYAIIVAVLDVDRSSLTFLEEALPTFTLLLPTFEKGNAYLIQK